MASSKGGASLSKSVVDNLNSNTKSLKERRIKNKKLWGTPLGLQSNIEEDEKNLEKLVLGEASGLFINPSEDTEKSKELDPKRKAPQALEEHKPAWTDQDPLEYTAKRVKKFETYNGNPQWAKLGRKRRSSSSDEEDQEVLQHAGNLLSRSTIKHSSLTKGRLEYKRNLDLNSETDHNGQIKAVEFHPCATVGLVAHRKGAVALYEVNGVTNPELQSIMFKDFPIDCAKFAANGTEFLVGSGMQKHMYSYDMEAATTLRIVGSKEITDFKKFRVSPDGSLIAVAGRFGYIHLLSARSKEVIGSLKMNAAVQAIAFNLSGTRLFTHGDEGELYVWDTNSRACIERFQDDGCLKGRALAMSSQYLATGCTSGAVNLYSATAPDRKPLKTLLNLVTPVTGLAFNASEEMLAMWSSEAANAIRLVHLPSFTTFANFPGRVGDPGSVGQQSDVSCMTFSPNGGFLAVGSRKEKVTLIRLKHYGNY